MNTTDGQMEAAKRLWNIANGDTGQCRVVAQFLLGLYNGYRFPFDLTEFRRLDGSIFRDCLLVLQMDNQPAMEIHRRLGKTSDVFDALADSWKIPG
jgi:hypothetical protein